MSPTPIYTIGYGAREIEAFVAVLGTYKIKFLLDVRSKPYSRFKPDFSKHAFESHLQAHNIRYIFMGDALGGQPDDPSCYDEEGKVIYDKVSQKSFFLQGIERVRQAWQKDLPVVLMCSEGKPEMCHRSKLIGRILSDEGIEVAHIDEKNQLINQHDVMLRLSKGQPSLFGEDFFRHTSRKSYLAEDEERD